LVSIENQLYAYDPVLPLIGLIKDSDAHISGFIKLQEWIPLFAGDEDGVVIEIKEIKLTQTIKDEMIDDLMVFSLSRQAIFDEQDTLLTRECNLRVLDRFLGLKLPGTKMEDNVLRFYQRKSEMPC
jgi:hypothetical protein